MSPLVLVASVAASVPTALYVLIVWRLDRREKEPWRPLAVAFVWGALSAMVVAVTVELVTDAYIASIATLHRARATS